MPIAERELNRDLIVVDEQATVQQVRDRVAETEKGFVYIAVRLADGRYAVLWMADIIQALQAWGGEMLMPGMLDTALIDVPDLLAPRVAETADQAEMDTSEARELVGRTGKTLVVLADSEVVGLMVGLVRKAPLSLDLDWLDQPVSMPAMEAGVLGVEEEIAGEPPRSPEVEPKKRWINAEIAGHDPAEPLQMGQVYTLAFDVDTELREAAAGGAEFRYRFQPDEEMVTLTVQLESDDFEIYTDPQKLRVPRTGRSKGKARFDVEPKREGEGLINALFLKDGNFVQLITLKLHTGVANRAGVLSSETLGRPVGAAFAVEPRDVSLTILDTGAGFQIIMSGAVGAMATLPITREYLDNEIAQVRQELLKIVHLSVGGSKVYQAGVEIPPNVNRHALRQLAKEGYLLYKRIFYGREAGAQANLLGDRLRQMAQGDKLKIQIFSQHFMLPWGILYVAEEYDPDNIDPEMFLGLKHIIEHIPLQPNMQVIEGTIDSSPGLAVSLNVNADIDQQMGAPLIANQLQYWERIQQSGGARVSVRRTEDEVVKALADTSTPDQILYFYCHAVSKSLAEDGGPDTSTLVLSGGQHLTLEDLDLFASTEKTLPGAPLVFINACESAELSPLFYDGFVPYFMDKGARGVIGTECETPALFAAEWAERFFDRFLAGGSLGQIALDLRREFFYEQNNLLGLLYALYVDGDTRIMPGVQVT